MRKWKVIDVPIAYVFMMALMPYIQGAEREEWFTLILKEKPKRADKLARLTYCILDISRLSKEYINREDVAVYSALHYDMQRMTLKRHKAFRDYANARPEIFEERNREKIPVDVLHIILSIK